MTLKFEEIRENNNLNQRQMAKTLKVSKSTYNYYESGERFMPLERLNDYCNRFSVSADYVLGLSSNNVVPKENFVFDPKITAERIKIIRLKKKLTQEKLAEKFNTSQSTISGYETNRTVILTLFVYDMCKKYNISIDYIMGRSNTMQIFTGKK